MTTKQKGVGKGNYIRSPSEKERLRTLTKKMRGAIGTKRIKPADPDAKGHGAYWLRMTPEKRREASLELNRIRWGNKTPEERRQAMAHLNSYNFKPKGTQGDSMSLAYTIVQHDPPMDQRSAAKLICAKCGAPGKIVIAGMGNNPEKIQKLFIRLGWDSDVFHRAANICPKCVKQREIRTAETLAEPPPRPPRILPVLRQPPQHFEPLGAGTRKGNTLDSIKDLSPQQKSDLRKALDDNFNEDTGQYEGDFNDRGISETLDIPMKIVVEFREALYGELREDPELAALRAMADDFKKVVGNLQASEQRFREKIEQLARKREK